MSEYRKMKESNYVLMEQGLSPSLFLPTSHFNRYSFLCLEIKMEAYCVTSRPEGSSSCASQVHSLFQQQRLQLLPTGNFIIWDLISLPARQCWASPAKIDFLLLLFLSFEHHYIALHCFHVDLELFFFLFPLSCWVFTHTLGHLGHQQHHREGCYEIA